LRRNIDLTSLATSLTLWEGGGRSPKYLLLGSLYFLLREVLFFFSTDWIARKRGFGLEEYEK